MKVILDAGLPKTGSKARQRFFVQAEQDLQGKGVCFPSSGRDGSWHRPLFDAVVKGDFRLVERLRQELEDADSKIGLISYEDFYTLPPDQILELKRYLPDLEVVLFLRRQDQLVSSYYNQLHKSHRISLSAIEAFERSCLDWREEYDFRQILLRWQEVVGRDALHIVLYDKGTSSVDAFVSAVKIEVDLTSHQETFPNRAVDGHGLSVLRHVKRLAADEQELPVLVAEAHRYLQDHFVQAGDADDRYLISLDDRQKLMSQYEDSNEWTRQHWFPERRSLFPPLEAGVLVSPDFAGGRQEAEEIVKRCRRRASQNGAGE